MNTALGNVSYSSNTDKKDFPETHEDAGRASGQRSVRDVGVACDPADVCGAPVDVFMMIIKDVFEVVSGGEVFDPSIVSAAAVKFIHKSEDNFSST
ncbi:hypothetical protein DNTS_035591 [Danionella cerebrum]|uniref:Uncharacterized protein n=1 Tax=Danionella cerebrum TaxID=2873325 RepID=A0A553NKY3_9TELE|nr:hypothetical protein DNTS_035591 [Danionella translucida]